MQPNYFVLKNGTLEIETDQLLILDNQKRQRNIEIITGVFGLIYAVSCALRGYKDHDNFWLIFGITLTLIWSISISYVLLSQTVLSAIPFGIIFEITFHEKRIGRGQTVRIILKNKKVRTFETDESFDYQVFTELLSAQKVKVFSN